MKNNNLELQIIVNGHSITEYSHEQRVYVEGREHSNFEIKLTNHNHFRVEAIVSVDGLSISDGKEAGLSSSGYVLKAYETISIPGWTISDKVVAAFQFAKKGKSYAEQSGSGSNVGVIGALIFKEYQPLTYPVISSVIGYCHPTTTIIGAGSTPIGLTGNQWSVNSYTNNIEISGVTGPSGPQIGTAFGQSHQFSTQSVSFSRGSMIGKIVVFYNSAEALKKLGIVLKPKEPIYPDPFPGLSKSCVPPIGWNG